MKMELSEEVVMVLLTTSEMGFSLTDEDHMVISHLSQQDLREGRTTDRFLAPAISKFDIKVGKQEEYNQTSNPEENDLSREILVLGRRQQACQSLAVYYTSLVQT
jgi:hypothetical protein